MAAVDFLDQSLELNPQPWAMNKSKEYYLFHLPNARAWLLDHLTPSLPVPTDDVVSSVFIESSALEQVISIHPSIAAEWAGLNSN
ncbi:hypothetical protein TNCV_3209491 [Trichonephila clavipes]|nr:hypothetical protein TNCV_3209491 [Trichonephila clavipes]